MQSTDPVQIAVYVFGGPAARRYGTHHERSSGRDISGGKKPCNGGRLRIIHPDILSAVETRGELLDNALQHRMYESHCQQDHIGIDGFDFAGRFRHETSRSFILDPLHTFDLNARHMAILADKAPR
mgnify:CR=1 FL=1